MLNQRGPKLKSPKTITLRPQHQRLYSLETEICKDTNAFHARNAQQWFTIRCIKMLHLWTALAFRKDTEITSPETPTGE